MVSVDKARHFVHANGTMWERALWDHLFDGGSIERVYQCLLCYKNQDGGWGHGLEHDIKCPHSNPLQGSLRKKQVSKHGSRYAILHKSEVVIGGIKTTLAQWLGGGFEA